MHSKLLPPNPSSIPEDPDHFRKKNRKMLHNIEGDENKSTILEKRKKLELGHEFGIKETHEERMESLKGDSNKVIGNIKRNIEKGKL